MGGTDTPAVKRDPAGLGQVLASPVIALIGLVLFLVTLPIAAFFLTKDFGPNLLHAVGRWVRRRRAR